jgi:hypothetical protein
MKTNLRKALILLLISIFLNSCETFERTYVEQEVDNTCGGITNSGTALVTYVWYKGEIAKSWCDDIEDVNDSLILFRKDQANKLINTLKTKEL